jgi:hypothetical protein
MMQVTAGLVDRAAAMWRHYNAVGDYATAEGYHEEYNIWSDEHQHWIDKADKAGC